MTIQTNPRTSARSRRRWLRRSAVVTMGLTTMGSLALASPAYAYESWQLYQVDGDACYDVATMDADGNGFFEEAWFDLDNDCRWDTRVWNSVGADNFAESATFDMDEDGYWETWVADNDQREGFDVAYFDDNHDGRYDRWVSLRPVASASGTFGFVGPPTNPSPFYTLMLQLAGETGTAVFGSSDRDGDGWYDHEDSWPGDPYRH